MSLADGFGPGGDGARGADAGGRDGGGAGGARGGVAGRRLRGADEAGGRGQRDDVAALLAELGRRRFTNVLVEGGGGALGAFLDADAIDEVHVYIAPLLAGGAAARTPIAGVGIEKIADALRLAEMYVEVVEGDVVLHGWHRPPAAPGGS